MKLLYVPVPLGESWGGSCKMQLSMGMARWFCDCDLSLWVVSG